MHIPDFLQTTENVFKSELKKLTTLPFKINHLSIWEMRATMQLDETYYILLTWDRHMSVNEAEWNVYLKNITNKNEIVHFRDIYANFLLPKYDKWISVFSQIKLPFSNVFLDIDIDKRVDGFRFYTLCIYNDSFSGGISVVIHEQDLENDLKRLIYLLKPQVINISTLNKNVSVSLTIETYNFNEKLLEWDRFFMIISSVMRYVQDYDTAINLGVKVIDGKIYVSNKDWLILLNGGKTNE